MPVIDITCSVCSDTFAFSEEDQEFYDSKGFQHPKKCKPCRDEAKRNRGGGGRGGYGGGGGYNRAPRQMFDAVCAGCNVDTQVPFEPNGSKPVYCRDCFQSRSSSY